MNGKNVLSGKGTQYEKVLGAARGGGMWLTKMSNMCGGLIEAFGEDEIYSSFAAGEDIAHFCVDECKKSQQELERRRKEDQEHKMRVAREEAVSGADGGVMKHTFEEGKGDKPKIATG